MFFTLIFIYYTKKTVSLSVFFEGAIISYVTKAHFMKNSLSVYFLTEQLFLMLLRLILFKTVSLSVFFEGEIISYVTKAHFMKNSLSVHFLREQLFESL